ncbi:MAG: hypothetical protein HC927_00670 [Deltaproteobacteria bacterium]|nr:hypothetical protein [Deltaproteobacteria bacterium]
MLDRLTDFVFEPITIIEPRSLVERDLPLESNSWCEADVAALRRFRVAIKLCAVLELHHAEIEQGRECVVELAAFPLPNMVLVVNPLHPVVMNAVQVTRPEKRGRHEK